MDELRAFYNNPGGRRIVKLRGPQTSGLRITRDDEIDDMDRKQEHRQTVLMSGTDYAHEIKERELQRYLTNEAAREQGMMSMAGGLDSLDHLSSVGISQPNLCELAEEAMAATYSKYSYQMKEDTNNLDINEFKDQIIDRIQSHPVVIIEGPTGCGKTTQVPQWILDDCYQRRRHCKVIVTQPRRIAAISIAKRVAQERGWDVGGLVGYQVGLENRTTTDTRIHYVTTGVLLQKLVSSKTMNEYTHIVLDEVHERGQEMDFLLLVVKRLLYSVSPNVKIVLMSATFNYKAFASYFLITSQAGLQPSSCVKIVKRQPKFSVKTFYLNELNKFGSLPNPKKDEPCIEPDMYKLVIKLLNVFESIDQTEDEYASGADVDIPSVLIFLPGINEIEELDGYLNNLKIRAEVAGTQCAKYKWWLLPLHSTITAEEQVRVFTKAPPGSRKIILSTNIAESSITVPDIKYVIDFCLMKVLVADTQTNFTSLQMQWAAKTNCEQRAGRAGRVRDGRVYRLINRSIYEQFDDECVPEIRRCPLERLVLLAKMLEMGPPSDILALAMDPPDLSNIHRTTLVLKEVGALKKTVDGEFSYTDGDITYLGKLMAKLPLDVRVSKLIMLGNIFGCLEDTVIMAAAMTVKNVFSSPFRERLKAYNTKLTWADGSQSDCLAFLNVYKVWSYLKKQQSFKQPGNSEHAWAKRSYVQVRALRELHDMVRELQIRLSREGIEGTQAQSPWNRSELPLIHKILIAGAFYPHYFIQVGRDEGREREACKMLGGLDPRTTVYLKDFPIDQPGPLYAASIRKIVHNLISDEPRVTFDANSMKVYLTFEDSSRSTDGARTQNNINPTIPGKVVLPVYKALKARQLNMDITVALLPQEKANQLAAAMAEKKKGDVVKNKFVPNLPAIDDTHFPANISQFVHCGHFWVQYNDESTATDLRLIEEALNNQPLLAHTGDIAPGEVLAGPYQDANGTRMYRVRVQKLFKDMALVFFIDYGGYARVNICTLRVLPDGICHSLPALAMECTLAEIAPSQLKDPHGQWTIEALRCFHEATKRGRLMGKVYSVAHGLVSIELLAENGRVSVNKMLVEKGFAQPCEESYESKLNHDLRETATELNNAQKRAYNRQQAELAFQELHVPEPPRAADCTSEVHLKGPFSPLSSKVYNLMYASHDKQVSIEWNSVNSVLLDTDPQEVYERLLVAGVVGTNEAGSKLTLRHTTLMPNIPGLPAIISMLFCPAAELRRDERAVRYVSVLCGLGCTEDGAPLLPEHDLLVNIDHHCTLEDISLINHVRHLMDFMMLVREGQEAPNYNDEFRVKVPKIIRESLMNLLSKRRRYHEPENVPFAWEWKSVPEEELLDSTEPEMAERAVVYPLHSPLDLRPVSRDELLQLKTENDKLTALVMGTPVSSNKEVVCKLCGTCPLTLQAMRIHIYSIAHREKEEDFRGFNA